jgi:dipeptidyl aminopeptidase/acylaminoacyl peptidase
VIIISGSGSQDRDGGGVANFYRLIAERLSRNGVAVLRVDDRGAGKSVPLVTRTTSYRDLVDDSKAAFEFLNSRKEIDHKRLALAGHSEGAQTALTIAAEDARVAAIILLAGTSRTLDRIVTEQALYGIALAAPVNPSDRTRFNPISIKLEQVFRDAKEKKPANAANDELTYYRDHLASDPLSLARKVRIPVLILNGERDGNVLAYHALELAQALADSGNKQVLVRIFPNLTHLFTPSQRDKAVTDTQAGEVNGEVLETIQKWATHVMVNGKDGGSLP